MVIVQLVLDDSLRIHSTITAIAAENYKTIVYEWAPVVHGLNEN